MGVVKSLLSNGETGKMTSDDIVRKVQPFINELSEEDKALFRYACSRIADEASKLNIINASVRIDFKGRDAVYIDVGKPNEQFISFGKNIETGAWEMKYEQQWLSRKIISGALNIPWEKLVTCVDVLARVGSFITNRKAISN